MVDTSYGSDQHGLIWGYRFTSGRAAGEVGSEAAARALSDDSSGGPTEFFWLHFSLANSSTESWLNQNFKLPPAFFDSLHGEAESTRLEHDDDLLVAVIHDVLFGKGLESTGAGSTCLCIGPRFLVSVRLRPLRSIDQLRVVVRSGHTFHSPVELLAHLLHEQANMLTDIVRRSTAQVNGVEDKLLANRGSSTTRAELGTMRRVLVRLQRLLAPEPAALFRLLNRPLDWISKDDVQELQEAAEEFSAAISDSAGLVERVRLIQEELAAINTEQTGRTLFVLTVVTVMALPINLVAGLFGMNVGGIPLAESGHGFLVVVMSLIALTGILAWVAWGRRS